MRPRRLVYEVLPAAVGIAAIAIVGLSWHLVASVRRVIYEEARRDLESRATLIATLLPGRIADADRPDLLDQVRTLGVESATRITIMLPSGEVVADSHDTPADMGNHATRPEMRSALAGRVGEATRQSATLDATMTYVAVPLVGPNGLDGVLRTSRRVAAVDAVLSDVRGKIIIGGLIAGLAGLGFVLLHTRRVSRQLDAMGDAARRFAEGDLSHRIPTQTTLEMAELADAMSAMASQLDRRLHRIERERDEREALLARMVEGVIVVDAHDRIAMMNPAAGELFHTNPEDARGRTLQEAVRNPAIQKLADDVARAGTVIEAEVTVLGPGECHLQAHGTPLAGAEGRRDAVMVVLNDVTRLRRLEDIRRDFAANVSHELRTPITSIKGFVETLRDGALDNPPDAERFLSIIEKQTDRLNAIIEDLLALSRLEQGDEAGQMATERTPLMPIIAAAVDDCRPRATDRAIVLAVECEPGVIVDANRDLLERAIANLIDNATKYGHSDTQVTISAESLPGSVAIRVSDHGPGIEPRHVERIFERFYRIDKARSRRAGGTGLGLAIVKHIAQAHGGTVSVDSAPGVGSTFSIVLPAPT